jgi:hypothetical protein
MGVFFLSFLSFRLARFNCAPLARFDVRLLPLVLLLVFSWRAESLKRKAKEATALKPAAVRGGGSSGGGDSGSAV